MKVIFKFILISAIIGLISSKTEKFLSNNGAKNPSIVPTFFVQENEEKRKEQSNDINLENFLRNFGLVLPNKRHQTTFLVKCDYSNKNLWGGAKFTSDDDNCNHQIEMSFSFGCSLTSGTLYIFKWA